MVDYSSLIAALGFEKTFASEPMLDEAWRRNIVTHLTLPTPSIRPKFYFVQSSLTWIPVSFRVEYSWF